MNFTSKKHQVNWDSTENINEFPEIVKAIFNKFYFFERYKFTLWVDKISNKFSNNIDWWISPPASRNLYYSDLFKNICILKTIKELSKNKINVLIIIDNLEMKKILKKNFSSEYVDIRLKYTKKLLKKYIYFFYILKNIFDFLVRFILVKYFIKKNIEYNNQKIILVDTYIIDSKKKEKNYYGDLLHFSKKSIKNRVLFIPSIIKKNIFDFYKILISFKNNKNYIFKENFLNIKDLFFCLFYFNRKKFFNVTYPKYENYDLSKLVYEEIDYNLNIFSIFLALSNYIFVKRLKNSLLKLKKVINWFENQPKDKSWNYSWRKYFPNVTTVGYQGFSSYPEYMNVSPSNLEFESKVIPQKIVVIGKKYINLRKEFCKILKIETGPALRFKKIFNPKQKLLKKFEIVIFLEGASKKLDRSILLKLINISKKLPEINFYVKAHPTLPIERLNISLPKNFQVLNYDFSYIAIRTKISIAYGNTSALIESLAYNCRLIVPYNNLYDKYNFKKLDIDKKLFKICSNDKILLKNLKNFFLLSKSRNFNNVINLKKKHLFQNVTNKNIKTLI